ncbi:MAG TPA: hypothetical protein VMB03_02690 [Bryobacteraceae bacterium]|nr:hypothetical protein [Bryobacteraceae bacterium]
MKIPPIAIPLFLTAVLLAQATKPAFTGRWEVDKSRSTARTVFVKHPELSGPPAPVPPAGHAFDTMRPQTITLRGSSLVIVDEPAGNLPERSFKLTTNNQPNITSLPGGGVNRSSTRWDGKQLVTTWVLEQGGMPIMRGTDRRSLSDDGATLIQERTVITPLHESQLHIVWIRRRR